VTAYIDAHAHLGDYGPMHVPRSAPDDLVRRLDALGVERLLVAQNAAFCSDYREGNRLSAQASERHAGRLFFYAVVNPNYPGETGDELDHFAAKRGFVGLKLHAAVHEHPLEGPGYEAAWKFAERRACPVLIHYWDPSAHCGPGNLKEVATRHPDVRIIVAHLGGFGTKYRELPGLAARHPNLWFDTCCSRSSRGTIPWLVKNGLGQRLLYGSDMPFIDPGAQLGKVLYADIPEEVRAAILGGNARRLFGWEE